MKKQVERGWTLILTLSITLGVLTACAATPPPPPVPGTLVPGPPVPVAAIPPITTDHMLFLSSDLLGPSGLRNPGTLRVGVYLPPDYYRSDRAYPVVYYLHGYGGDETELRRALGAARFAMSTGQLAPMILVAPAMKGPLGGSFYTDSPVTGAWARWFLEAVLPEVETTFRVKRDRLSRGLTGFSMGGSGGLTLGFARPDLFGAVLALSPGILKDGDLPAAWSQWDARFRASYAAAWAPDPAAPDRGLLPSFDGSPGDTAVQALWYAGFGAWDRRIASYLAQKHRFAGLALHVGSRDDYAWIPRGTADLAAQLSAAGIAHDHRVFDRGHDFNAAILAEEILPWFAGVFSR